MPFKDYYRGRAFNCRPTPREGFGFTLLNNKLLILGGDRHKLSLEDFYECNLDFIHAKK